MIARTATALLIGVALTAAAVGTLLPNLATAPRIETGSPAQRWLALDEAQQQRLLALFEEVRRRGDGGQMLRNARRFAALDPHEQARLRGVYQHVVAEMQRWPESERHVAMELPPRARAIWIERKMAAPVGRAAARSNAAPRPAPAPAGG